MRLDHVSRVPPTCRDAADSAPACVWTQDAAAALSWAPAPANKHSYSLHIGNKTIVCSSYRPPVKEEQVPPRPRVFHCVLDKFDNSWALKSCKTSKTKISCKNDQEVKRSCYSFRRGITLIMLYSDVSDKSVEFEGEAEDVVVVAAVPHHEAAVGLPRQDPLSSLAREWTPVPTSLKSEASSGK